MSEDEDFTGNHKARLREPTFTATQPIPWGQIKAIGRNYDCGYS